MKVIGAVETIQTSVTARTETDRDTYDQGFWAMQRALQEGTRLVSIRVER